MIKFYPAFYIAVLVLVSCGNIVKEKAPGEKVLEVSIKNSVRAERSDHFFGHNLFVFPSVWGDNTAGTENIIRPLSIRFLRFGGEISDTEYLEKINGSMLKTFFDYCKSINAEPLLQLPVMSGGTLKDRIARAMEVLKESVLIYPSLSYIGIGNEPDLYSSYTSKKYYSPGKSYFSGYTVDDCINDFTNIAAAVREEYPRLKITGPDLSWKYFQPEDVQVLIATGAPELKSFYSQMTNTSPNYDWLSPFIKACSGYIDIVNIHAYPLPLSSLCSYKNARSGYDQIDACMTLIRKKIDLNSGSRRLPLAFTEIGITSDGDPAHGTYEASPGTFNAALWMADFLGIAAAREKIFSVMPWSIHEFWNVSFLDYKTAAPRPVFYVYKIFSEHSRKYSIFAEKFGNVRIYAGRDEKGGVSIFIVNWDRLNKYRLNLSFSGQINDASLNYTVEPWSLTCLTAEPGQTGRKCYVYRGDDPDKGYTESEW